VTFIAEFVMDYDVSFLFFNGRWNEGTNHLLFNMLPGKSPDYSPYLEGDTGKAIVAGGGLSTVYYRRSFDVAIPVFSPLVRDVQLSAKSYL
jgi:glucuronyl/N-acetylglucosaminyl transferase EXT2